MNLQNELGKRRSLMVVKIVDFGVYLGTKDEKVLLPKKEVPAGIEVGDPIEVFLYKDSSDRIIATTRTPKLMMGEVKVLEVADTARIGAFPGLGTGKRPPASVPRADSESLQERQSISRSVCGQERKTVRNDESV